MPGKRRKCGSGRERDPGHFYWYASDYCDVFLADRILEQIDPERSFAADLIEHADLMMTGICIVSANILRKMNWGQRALSAHAAGGDPAEDGGRIYGRVQDRFCKYRKRSVEKVRGKYPFYTWI